MLAGVQALVGWLSMEGYVGGFVCMGHGSCIDLKLGEEEALLAGVEGQSNCWGCVRENILEGV